MENDGVVLGTEFSVVLINEQLTQVAQWSNLLTLAIHWCTRHVKKAMENDGVVQGAEV